MNTVMKFTRKWLMWVTMSDFVGKYFQGISDMKRMDGLTQSPILTLRIYTKPETETGIAPEVSRPYFSWGGGGLWCSDNRFPTE
jgi:hypothetical protein